MIDENEDGIAKDSGQVTQLTRKVNQLRPVSAIVNPVVNRAAIHEDNHDDSDNRCRNLQVLRILNITKAEPNTQRAEHQ